MSVPILYEDWKLPRARPWPEFIERFKLPSKLDVWIETVSANISYYQTNYLIIFACMLGYAVLCDWALLWVLPAIVAAWLYTLVVRDGPLVIAGNRLDKVQTVIALSIATILLLALSSTTLSFIWIFGGSAFITIAHASLRPKSLRSGFNSFSSSGVRTPSFSFPGSNSSSSSSDGGEGRDLSAMREKAARVIKEARNKYGLSSRSSATIPR